MKTTLKYQDDLVIALPDSLEVLTTYVLHEQGDWFEPEILFMREVLRPDEKVIDVGANFGVYTLAMAKAVGKDGRVWAYEPAKDTFSFLAESLRLNQYAYVLAQSIALSDQIGRGELLLDCDAESRRLSKANDIERMTESVALTTLDHQAEIYDWDDISYIKIDAEGEEIPIVRGGQRFLKTNSPLIQYEIKHGDNFNYRLADELKAFGYISYRLIPAIGVLSPFDPATETIDSYQLNLFCCKPDRAALLAERSRLIAQTPESNGSGLNTADFSASVLAEILIADPATKNSAHPEFEDAIRFYATSRSHNYSLTHRARALAESFRLMAIHTADHPGVANWITLARIANEFGKRDVAVDAFKSAYRAINAGEVFPNTPFLAASGYYEGTFPRQPSRNWLLSSVMEGLEKSMWFSSFFSPEMAIDRLRSLISLGFASDEMQRRIRLVESRFNTP